MTTDAPVIKEIDIPHKPIKISKPAEFPVVQPDEHPIKVPRVNTLRAHVQ